MLKEGQEPTKPFECAGADLFTIGGKEYFAYIEILSSWPVAHTFNKADFTTANVIKPIRRTFTDDGIPKVFESNNGPQFASIGFQKVVDDILLYASDVKEHAEQVNKNIAPFLRPWSFGKQIKS